MNLEVVTVCVGYGDFLTVTAQHNAQLFDRWVIVTSEKDEETREICRKYNLETLLTEDFYLDGQDFAKSRGINRGLNMLSANTWRLHLDADIVLPSMFRQVNRTSALDMTCVYGVDRVMVKSWKEWEELRTSDYLQHDYHCRTNFPPNNLKVGTRWVSPHSGYVPIGFFQLWHSSVEEWRGIKQRRYPDKHNSASRCDVQFGLEWDRSKRLLIPEIIAIHLESEAVPLGRNWNGRKSKKFCPPKPYCE